MFYYVEGKVALAEPGLAVIDCGGVGYACLTSTNTISHLKTGDSARLYTYLHVREDIFELYGFIDPQELSCFKMLIGISGVGPKAALAILSSAPPERVVLSILTGDERALCTAQGVGKKLAQRIILELKDKLAKSTGGSISMPAADSGLFAAPDNVSEALSALVMLGYSSAEAAEAVKGIDPSVSPEDIIRAALKKLSSRLG